MKTAAEVRLRPVRASDAPALAAIDRAHAGRGTRAWWEQVVARHVHGGGGRVGLVAVAERHVVGYVLGQVREFEFGSEPCGWIFAVGVHPDRLRAGVASRLFAGARERFAELGVGLVRTMVRRDDVPVLTFFRNQGFVAGPYVELELALPRAPGGEGGA
jgi:ribosomal protein S18 acetylase RimI-like enzyme